MIRCPRDTPIWKLEAALRCRSWRKGRYAPPVHIDQADTGAGDHASACIGSGSTSPPWASQKNGIKEVDDGIWLASFTHYDLGYSDLEQKTKTLHPLDNPFGTRLSPMS